MSLPLRVIAPFTLRHPEAERALKEFAPEAEWWDVSASIFAYSQLVESLWKEAQDFLLVEHDIEITAEALREAQDCPCEWSVSPYKGPSAYGWEEAPLLTMSLGCTRFRSGLMTALPNALIEANAINDAGTVCPPGDWKRLDCRLHSVLRGGGETLRTPHIHSEVPHHHQFSYGCSCGREH